VTALAKSISDHVSLLVDTKENYSGVKKKFRFEKWWLEREDFREVVKKTWTTKCPEDSAIDAWQFRVRTLRRMVRGWVANVTVELNKQKQVAIEFN
jgi:hypothetical protein